MKKWVYSILVLVLLTSCEKDEKELDVHFIKFQLKETDQNAGEISFVQESPEKISGNGVKGGGYVAVGFNVAANFESPNLKDTPQELSIRLSVDIPEDEFNINSGAYKFKNPSNFQNYIPSRNLMEDEEQTVFTFFHEDVQTFCTAQLDKTFSNNFRITKTNYYTDDSGLPALDIEGIFMLKFNSICNNGDIEISDGSFRLKLLIDEIP